jgi:hypothetical protein
VTHRFHHFITTIFVKGRIKSFFSRITDFHPFFGRFHIRVPADDLPSDRSKLPPFSIACPKQNKEQFFKAIKNSYFKK